MPCSKFSMTLPTEILSTETSDFLKQIIFLKSFNSVFKIKQCVVILRIQRLEGKQCRSSCHGSLQDALSESTLFTNATTCIFIFSPLSVNPTAHRAAKTL